MATLSCRAGGLLSFLLVALSFAWIAECYPESWQRCDHPNTPQGPHLVTYQNAAITFELLDGDRNGEPVATYAPGRTYTLKVTPHARSEGILTVDRGSVRGLGEDTSNDWATRCTQTDGTARGATFGARRTVFFVEWTAPSSGPESTEPLRLKATFAEKSVGDFVWNEGAIPANVTSALAAFAVNTEGAAWSGCGTEDGKRICDIRCRDVKVTKAADGTLKLRCVIPEDA